MRQKLLNKKSKLYKQLSYNQEHTKDMYIRLDKHIKLLNKIELIKCFLNLTNLNPKHTLKDIKF